MDVIMIAAREIDEYAKKPGCIVLDIRNRDDYEEFHLPCARNVEKEWIRQEMLHFGDGYQYLILCDHGSQSLLVARALCQMGYSAISAYGGMEAYRYHQKMIKKIDG